jgi:DNA repair protein RadD
MTSLADHLRRLDSPTLERLAGTTIVRAVSYAFDTNKESELARLVSERLGLEALSVPEVRACILESFSRESAISACQVLSIPLLSSDIPQAKVANYFSGSFTLDKSRRLVEVLGLPGEYARQPVVDERQATELLERPVSEAFKVRGYLHPYQIRIKDRVVRSIEQMVSRVMVQMPTGAGKTATALETVVDIFRLPLKKRFVVWLVDSAELAEQALETFKSLWLQKGDRPIAVHRMFGTFDPDFFLRNEGFIVTTFDKLRGPISNAEHASHGKVWKVIRSTDLLIVDEAHTSVAETYEQIIRAFLGNSDARLIGLSATPARNATAGTVELANLYSGQLITITDANDDEVGDVVGYLQSEGYLAKLVTIVLESGASTTDRDEKRICKALAEHSERNRLIVKQIEIAYLAGEPTLVFSCTKDHVFALMALCRASKIDAGFIVGETPQSERNRLLNLFRRGDLRVLINYDILSTGVDLPNVRRLIISRPIGSPILFSQMLGRALRGPRNGGFETNTVVTLRDNLLNYTNENMVYQSFASEFEYAA